MACWLAGVVQGICTVHSCTACEPLSSHAPQRRHRARLQHPCMTGNETPSSWTNTTPSTSGSETLPGLIRSRLAAKDSSVPALTSHTSRVPNAAASQAAATGRARTSRTTRPGTMSMAICITMACPNSVAAPTASQPMARHLDEHGTHDHADDSRDSRPRPPTATTRCT
jgi:hypothetical protein